MPSVFHPGELHVQHLAGTHGVAEELSAVLSTQFNLNSRLDALLSSLRLAWLTTVDASSSSATTTSPLVWVSPVFGAPGFVRILSHTSFAIHIPTSHPAHDPLLLNILSATPAPEPIPIAFLAIDLEHRLRYRTNGVVQAFDPSTRTLTIRVKEAFPNCPKYIQKRVCISSSSDVSSIPIPISTSATLSPTDQTLLRSADTIFLGTYYPPTGPDVSHRGGSPGFVRVLSPTELFFPDYRGNGMFQSFGNLHADARASLAVLDFDTGHVLQLSGTAVIDWDVRVTHPSLEGGASRGVRFHIAAVSRSNGPATTLRWRLVERSPYSPMLPGGGLVQDDKQFATLVKIMDEAHDVKTFRFLCSRRVKFLPGQYATFEFGDVGDLSGGEQSIVRTWTVSETANSMLGDVTLEVTVLRKRGGTVSEFLHARARPGLRVGFVGVGGELTPFGKGGVPRKLLLISGGIGITPIMAILRGLGARDEDGVSECDVVMLHQVRALEMMPFRKEIVRRAERSDGRVRVCVFESGRAATTESEVCQGLHVRAGRIEMEMVREMVAEMGQRVVYLCGPPGFMDKMTDVVVGLGVKAKNVMTEKFDF